MENKKISFNAKILAVSFWMIFFTIEGSFSVQILLPFLIILLIYLFIIKKASEIKINFESKILFLFLVSLIITTIISYFRYNVYFNNDTIIGVLYFIVIFLWYLFNTNLEYSNKEISFVISSYIWMSLGSSILLILNYLSGTTGKIAMINLVNTEIDENYASALIAMASIFLFNRILNKNMPIKQKIIYIIIFITNILAVALSGSRAALIATLISIFFSFIFVFSKKITFKKIAKLLIVIISIFVVGNKIIDYIPSWTFNRYFNNNYADSSNTNRLLMWKNGIDGVANNPIFGYSIRIFDKIPEYSSINGFKIPDRVPAHQTYIDLMLYSGIIGFIFFIIFMISIFKIFLKKDNKIYLPMIFVFIFITNIIGAERSVFMWNNLIIFTLISNNLKKKKIEQSF